MAGKDPRPVVSERQVLDALRCGESEQGIRALTLREIAVMVLGFDPRSRLPEGVKPSRYSEFTPYVSIHALRKTVDRLVEAGAVTLLTRPAATFTPPESVRQVLEAERSRAAALRRNKHHRIERGRVEFTPEQERAAHTAHAEWMEQRTRLSRVTFTSSSGYVVTETLALMDDDVQVLGGLEEARKIKGQANREVMDSYRDRIARDVERLTRKRLREAGLPSPERFNEAGVRLF